MGSLDSIFSSKFSEQRWPEEISKNFDREVVFDISNVPVSVFNVPIAMSSVKPEAYVPQIIALGPYHHLRPELYQMERYKVSAIRALLKTDQIVNFQSLVIQRMRELEPTIRACYHKYLNHDDDTLAWIIAIDGLFLLDLLREYNANPNDSNGRKLTQDAVLYRDVMVLENQIPVILLKEIRKTLQLSSPDDPDDTELISTMEGFCKSHTPLKLAPRSDCPATSFLHLLDLIYNLIVCRQPTDPAPENAVSFVEEVEIEMGNMTEEFLSNVGGIVNAGANLGIGGRPIRVIRNVPWKLVSNLLGHKPDMKLDKDNSQVIEEVKVPSVTRLHKSAGVKFSPTTGGIKDIMFVEKEATVYLPVLTLNSNSEVLLRNLVAYEAATSDSTTLELAQYIDLMSGIIDKAEDVKLLKEKGIIEGDLASDQIVELFNGMNRSSDKRSNMTIRDINAYFNKQPTVKMYKFMKKNVYASWKALTVLSTVLLLVLVMLQAFCGIYGCPRLFGGF